MSENGSIAANNTTVTVKGPGKLIVNGAGDNIGISGNINVKGADVEIIGKPSKGKCTIVAFAHNGVSKRIKVTVK